MELHIPGYYPKFRCLAGDCPHTCCAWWEVPVDGESAAFYQAIPGELGQKLRSALTAGEDGEPCFRLTGGKCPFLDKAGLCSLQLKWGEERIPFICREHPRFTYDYGSVREVGLCASCPEAARLILEEDFSLSAQTISETGEDAHPLLEPLLQARAWALAILFDKDLSLPCRLQALLLFANEAQNLADEEDWVALPQLCDAYAQAVPQPDPASLPQRREALSQVLNELATLEILQPAWRDLLAAAQARLEAGESLSLPPTAQGERAAAYFLYRHWLRALNDGDLLTWAEFAVLGTVVSGALADLDDEGFPGVFRLLCLELEHSQDNLDALQDALWERLNLAQLLALCMEN